MDESAPEDSDIPLSRFSTTNENLSSQKHVGKMGIEFTRLHILKLFELIIALGCFTLHSWICMWTDHYYLNMLSCGSYGGYIVINTVTFVSVFISQPVPVFMDVQFTAAGCIMFLGASILCFFTYTCGDFTKEVITITKCSLSLLNSALFFADLVWTVMENR